MYFGKEVSIFIHKVAFKKIEKLLRKNDEQSRNLIQLFERQKELLKINPQLGDTISKDKIPFKWKQKGITNLYRIPLTSSWRVLYTITSNKKKISIFIISFEDHKDYENRMNYLFTLPITVTN